VYSLLLLEGQGVSLKVKQSEVQRLVKALDRPTKSAAMNFTKEIIKLSHTGTGIKHTLRVVILVCSSILAVCLRPTQAFAANLFTKFLTAIFQIFGPIITMVYGAIMRIVGAPERIMRKLQKPEVASASSLPWTLIGAFLGVTLGLAVVVLLNPAMNVMLLIIVAILCLALYIGYEIFSVTLSLSGGKVLDHKQAEKLTVSHNVVERSIGKAYLLAVDKNPGLAKMHITYNFKDRGMYKVSPGAYVLPYPKKAKIFLTGTEILRQHFKEDELTAVVLHEIGHIVTQERVHPIALILQHALSGIPIIALTPIAPLQIVMYVLYGLYLSYKRLYSETLADSYSVSLGYGIPLENALKRLEEYYHELSRKSTVKGAISGFLSHYASMRTRLKLIRSLEEQTKKLGNYVAPKVKEKLAAY